MEVFQLRYLTAAAETLNFTRAAEKLHVSQSALIRQIQALEKELGVTIFERNRQRVMVTDEGRLLLRHAQRMLSEVSAMEGVAKDLGGGLGGELIIGCDWSIFSQ